MLEQCARVGLDREGLPSARASAGNAPEISTTRIEPGARSILRAATDDVHQRMHRHAGFALLAAGTIERAAYRRLLARSYGFYVMAERLVERAMIWFAVSWTISSNWA